MKTPPSRAFLEEQVQADRFGDYLSRRSPVWKERPLPGSKREAIALMLELPTLIKRPILIAGATIIFGFDKEAYAALARRRRP